MKKLEEIRRDLNQSTWGRSYNQVEGVDRLALPIAAALLGSGIGYAVYVISSNFDQVVEGVRYFHDNCQVLGG